MVKIFIAILLLSFSFSKTSFATDEKIIIKSGKAKRTYAIEIADDDVEREQGLMFRTSMERNHGMLFIFKNPQVQNFWMKNTMIPLDILFIDASGKIVTIKQNAQPQDLSFISSEVPVLAALELNGGEAKKSRIKTGAKVIYPVFASEAAKPVAKH